MSLINLARRDFQWLLQVGLSVVSIFLRSKKVSVVIDGPTFEDIKVHTCVIRVKSADNSFICFTSLIRYHRKALLFPAVVQMKAQVLNNST